MFDTIDVRSTKKVELIEITDKINNVIEKFKIKDGICFLNVPHTTAGITINENADPSVIYDIQSTTSRLIPPNNNYTHYEGNADAHIKSSIFGQTLTLIIENTHIVLGTWQGVFFCEFDGPRNRKVYVKILSG